MWRSSCHLLRFEISCLLSGNLILQVLNVLLGLGDVDGDSQEAAAVASHGFLRLSHRVLLLQGLERFDLLKQLVQRDQGLWG